MTTEDPRAPAKTLTEVFDVKQLRRLGLVCFAVVAVLLVLMIFMPELIDSQMARFAYLIAVAVFLSIFFFILYPHETVASKGPLADLAIRVAGPAALLFAVFTFLHRYLPPPDAVLYDGQYFLFSQRKQDNADIYDHAYAVALKQDHVESVEKKEDGFAEVPLAGSLVDPETLLVSSGLTKLGTISDLDPVGPPEPPRVVTERKPDPATALRLGIYYGTCEEYREARCVQRRDSQRAKSKLLEALGQSTAVNFTQKERDLGAQLLYRLHREDEISVCADLSLTVVAVETHRSVGDFKHHEMAELYNQLARRLNDADDLRAARRNSVHYYLRYLSASPRTDLEEPVRNRVRELLMSVQPERAEELTELMNTGSKAQLKDASFSFEVRPVSC